MAYIISSFDELRDLLRSYIGSGWPALNGCHWIGAMAEIDSCSNERLIELARQLGFNIDYD